jgi:uncharacterized membrane protein YeaQ/YmgE (transglycosylase-associated protein family)
MHGIWVILIGVAVGALAKLVIPGRGAPGGAILAILLGIAGSFIAIYISTYIGRAAGGYALAEPAGLIASIVGAALLRVGYRMVTGRRGAV